MILDENHVRHWIQRKSRIVWSSHSSIMCSCEVVTIRFSLIHSLVFNQAALIKGLMWISSCCFVIEYYCCLVVVAFVADVFI